jgi:predicted dehydrogenase
VEQDDLVHWTFREEGPRDNEIRERFRQKTGASGGASNPAAISHEGHARQLRDFAQAIRSGGKPLVDGREGRRAVELIEAIYKSATTGSFVRL